MDYRMRPSPTISGSRHAARDPRSFERTLSGLITVVANSCLDILKPLAIRFKLNDKLVDEAEYDKGKGCHLTSKDRG